MSAPVRFPRFFVTNPGPCPYLPDKIERKVFTELNGPHAEELNDALGRIGFRRSQNVAYRPSCLDCKACVSVRVLTNAYEASDVPLVHAGYAQYRPALLQSGVALYEKQRLAPKKPGVRLNPLGSSGSSLHAKTFAVDGERAFVGSFNFDPRSALLNTELGFVIDSPLLAGQIEQAFATNVPQSAYTLGLSGTGEVQWHSPDDGLHTTEPGSRWWSRLGLRLLALLPIEWLL